LYRAERARNPGSTVHVIAMYKAQKDLIQRLMPECRQQGEEEQLDPLRTEPYDPLLVVGTVDATQGSEAAVVIMSCVRSNLQSQLGFTKHRQRVTVALSRAQCELHVVADASTLCDPSVKRTLWHDVMGWVHKKGGLDMLKQHSNICTSAGVGIRRQEDPGAGPAALEILEPQKQCHRIQSCERILKRTARSAQLYDLAGAQVQSLHAAAASHNSMEHHLRQQARNREPEVATCIHSMADNEDMVAREYKTQASEVAFLARNGAVDMLESVDLHGMIVQSYSSV